MTKQERETRAAIKLWCEKSGKKPVVSLRHVYPRAYVLGRAASRCLLVACPPMDAEPQIQDVKKIMDADGSTVVHSFDENLKAGDWCSVAYVVVDGCQERVAIPAV